MTMDISTSGGGGGPPSSEGGVVVVGSVGGGGGSNDDWGSLDHILPTLDFMGASSISSGHGSGSSSSGSSSSNSSTSSSTSKRRTDHRYDSSESSDSGVATLSPSSTTSGDTAPYSPSADSSSSSSDCSSSPDAPPPPRLVPIFKKKQPPSPSLPTSTSIMTAVSAVSAVLAAADHKQRRPSVYTPNTSYTKQIKPSPTPPSTSTTTTSSTKPSSGGVGKDFLAVALSFHAAQQEEKASKQQQLNNNNNNALTLNKNAAPQHLSPQPGVAPPPTQEDLNKSSAVPSKKARLDSGTNTTTPKPLTSPTSKSSIKQTTTAMPSTTTTTTPGNNKKVFTMTIPTALQQLSSTLKKAKRKLAEAEKQEDEPDVKILGVEVVSSVEATAVLGGRVCSVAESLKVATTSVSIIPGGVVAKGEIVDMCLWRGCCAEVGYNLLEHIQTVHVGSQSKGEVGFVCLWEGCKVFNRKSSSRSWLERHVLFHSGNKPFKCIFPGCGQSFGVQGALERHVNSHMASNCGGALSLAAANRNKIDANSPLKGVGRRKKQRCRKQRLNLGQHVDYFDKRVMELIKHRLASSISSHTVSAHHCTFRGQVLAKRRVAGEEAQLLVQWFPASIIPDEWIPLKEFHPEKTVPLTSLPKHKLPLVFPSLFPTQHVATDKARRKWSPSSSSSFLDNGDEDEEENSDRDEKVTKLLLPDDDQEINSTSSCKTSPSSSSSSSSSSLISSSSSSSSSSTSQQKVSSKHNNKTAAAVSSSPSLCSEEDEDGDDWALDALLDDLFLTTVSSSSS